MRPDEIKLTTLRATDGGARLILGLEWERGDGAERETLTVFSARLAHTPRPGVLTPEEVEFYRHEAAFCEAVGVGLRSLGAGAGSRARLVQKLRVRGIAPEIAREAAEELARRGYLDEIAGAVREAERGLAKYWGNSRILADLKAKGYPAAACRAAAGRLAGEDSVARLRTLLRRRHIRAPKDKKELARLVASLVRFGYTQSEIRQVLSGVEE